jgi:hypothetical protein
MRGTPADTVEIWSLMLWNRKITFLKKGLNLPIIKCFAKKYNWLTLYYSIFSSLITCYWLILNKIEPTNKWYLLTEIIQCILKYYQIDHIKQLFKVFYIEFIVIFWEPSIGLFLN